MITQPTHVHIYHDDLGDGLCDCGARVPASKMFKDSDLDACCAACEVADAQEAEAICADIDGVLADLHQAQPSRTLTVARVRQILLDLLDEGDRCADCPASHVWYFDPLDESDTETERRMRFVDQACKRLQQ